MIYVVLQMTVFKRIKRLEKHFTRVYRSSC